MEIEPPLFSVSWHRSGAHVHNRAFITVWQQATGLSPSLHPDQANHSLIILGGLSSSHAELCLCVCVCCLGDLMQPARDPEPSHVRVALNHWGVQAFLFFRNHLPIICEYTQPNHQHHKLWVHTADTTKLINELVFYDHIHIKDKTQV